MHIKNVLIYKEKFSDLKLLKERTRETAGCTFYENVNF